MTDLLPDIATAFSGFFSAFNNRVPGGAVLTSAKAALIGRDGKYAGAPVEIQLNVTGGINDAYSPQDAIVVTMVSGKWKDPGKYNRCYIPTVGNSNLGGWRLTEGEQNVIATNFAAYLDDVNEVMATEFPMLLLS